MSLFSTSNYRTLQAWLLCLGVVFGGFINSTQIQAQGWEIYFGGGSFDIGEAAIQTIDEGYIVTGYSESFTNSLSVYVIRTDVDGTKIWETVIDEGSIQHCYDIIPATDGGYILLGDIQETFLDDINVSLLKIDEDGNLLWMQQYGGDGTDAGLSVASTPDGGYIITGRTTSFGNGKTDVFLVKTDVNGVQEWSKTFGGTESDRGEDVIPFKGGYALTGSLEDPMGPTNTPDLLLLLTDANGDLTDSLTFGGNEGDRGMALQATLDGGLIITGSTGNNSDLYLIKTDANGLEEWSKTYGGDLADGGNDVIQLADGNYVVVGFTELSASNPDIYLLKTDSDGVEIWSHEIGRNVFWDEGKSIALTTTGGFVIGGVSTLFGPVGIPDYSLLKVDSTGNIHTNYIQGTVAYDNDNDCEVDSDEPGLKDWVVIADGAERFYGTTDADGFYSIRVDTGIYNVLLVPKNSYWDICEDTIFGLPIDIFYDTTFIDYAVKNLIACPWLEVDIATPFMQPCETKNYTVNYCNYGTIDANNGLVNVVLDPNLMYNSATLTPIQIINDSLYQFDIGTVAVGDCGSFEISVTLDCSTVEQEAIFTSAHIFPDSICSAPGANWDGSTIKVGGYCDNDSVRFEVKNIGPDNMQAALDYIVIEDQIMGLSINFQLDSGKQKDVVLPATGDTYRIIAEQSPGHPGDSYPTFAVEGCDNGTSVFSTGIITQFEEDEGDPFVSIDVRESISSNQAIIDLRGYPKGYVQNDTNYIKANTEIEYHIIFQNTGTDTAKRVVIRDTLSSNLDITTVRPGASSHPYNFQIYDKGILKITFEDIHLPPDSSADTSLGFVKFKVAQKPNNPIGTKIDNSAAIFLGYYEPYQTATYSHVVGGNMLQDFVLITSTNPPLIPGVEIKTYPNPFIDATMIEIEGDKTFQELTFLLYDLNGRLIRREKFFGKQLEFYRKDLSAGIYFYSIKADGQLLSNGKIIAQ